MLYVRTNNNTDLTEEILRNWIARIGPSYAGVEFDAAPVEEPVETFGPHEWNPTRFRVLGNIRNISLLKVAEHFCNFYFVCDVDNFITSFTLRELVVLNLPIVAPLLRVIDRNSYYSNFFAEIDQNGYYCYCDQYQWILEGRVRGVFEVPVVHCTYLIRADAISDLRYLDGSERYEFVVFSDSARKAGIQQYIDNRQLYGYITFDPESDAAAEIVGDRKNDQIAIACAELERVDGLKWADSPQFVETDEAAEELRRRFSEIHHRQNWGPGSGVGSAQDKTVEYRAFLQDFIARNRIRSVVDLGCGDWQFSRLIDWSGVRYLGLDVNPSLIEKNRCDFGASNVVFDTFESLAKLPRADLLLCKDVLQHLPNNMVAAYLTAFRKKYKFALITNDEEPSGNQNANIDIGDWRTLRLDRPPFSEPGAIVLSWRVPYMSGGTTKSTYLLQGGSAARVPPRAIASDQPAIGSSSAPGRQLRILIYTQTNWAFGAVHSSLAAHLRAAGWVADIKDWSQQYYLSEFQNEVEQYDYVLTVASGGNATLVHSYGIPVEKIVIVAHDEWDVQQMIAAEGIDDFDRYAGYGVISDTLACSSIALGVKRVPFVVRYGVECSKYSRDLAPCLSSVGYATVMQRQTVSGVERKRGELAKDCAEAAGLRFVPVDNLPFDAMPDFYDSVDSVVMPSLQEGAGLPPLEGAAAGRLVIGTPVGHFPRLAYEGLGILAPLEAGAFQRFTTETLIYYRDNPSAYVEICAAIQEAAQQRDWQYTVKDWIELFANAGRLGVDTS